MADCESYYFSIAPVPNPIPPSVTGTKFGLHVLQMADKDLIRSLASQRKIAGLTIINDTDFANEMAAILPYVVLRFVATDHDASPISSNSTQAGYEIFNSSEWWGRFGPADRRVIIQLNNETNQDDGEFWIGAMNAANEKGRKLIIFNDSVGHPDDDKWLARKPALAAAKRDGHYVGLHTYGFIDGNYHPLTAFDETNIVNRLSKVRSLAIRKARPIMFHDKVVPSPFSNMSFISRILSIVLTGAFRWYGGRFIHLYDILEDVYKADLILNECGSSGDQLQAGYTNWLHDKKAFDDICGRLPYVKSFNWWTVGFAGGWQKDNIEEYLRQGV